MLMEGHSTWVPLWASYVRPSQTSPRSTFMVRLDVLLGMAGQGKFRERGNLKFACSYPRPRRMIDVGIYAYSPHEFQA